MYVSLEFPFFIKYNTKQESGIEKFLKRPDKRGESKMEKGKQLSTKELYRRRNRQKGAPSFSFRDYPVLMLIRVNRTKLNLKHQLLLSAGKRNSLSDPAKRWEWMTNKQKNAKSSKIWKKIYAAAKAEGISKADYELALSTRYCARIRHSKLRSPATIADREKEVLNFCFLFGEAIPEETFCELERGRRKYNPCVTINLWIGKKLSSVHSNKLIPVPNHTNSVPFEEIPQELWLDRAEYYLIPYLSDYSPKKALEYLLKIPNKTAAVQRNLAYIYLYLNPYANEESDKLALRTLFITARSGDALSAYILGKYYLKKKEYKLARTYFDKGKSLGFSRCVEEIGNRIWNRQCTDVSKFTAAKYFAMCFRSETAYFSRAKICMTLSENEGAERHLIRAASLGSFDAREYYVRWKAHSMNKRYERKRFIFSNQIHDDPTGFLDLVNFRLLTMTGSDGSVIYYLYKALAKGHVLAPIYQNLYYSKRLKTLDDE